MGTWEHLTNDYKFSGYRPTICQSGYNKSDFHQQCVKIQVAPYLHQIGQCSFFILDILVSVQYMSLVLDLLHLPDN